MIKQELDKGGVRYMREETPLRDKQEEDRSTVQGGREGQELFKFLAAD